MCKTYFALFCALCTILAFTASAVGDDICGGQACQSIESLAEGEDGIQGLEMLQLKSATKAAHADPAPGKACPQGEKRSFKASGLTGAECQAMCNATAGCKYWSHAPDMEKADGMCYGCKVGTIFDDAPGMTTSQVGDLMVVEEKPIRECIDVGFAPQEPNDGPTCLKVNAYCGPEGADGCLEKKKQFVKKVGLPKDCKCGKAKLLGYSTTGEWCRNCLPYPVGTSDVMVVKQAAAIKGLDGVKMKWYTPKQMLRAPFQICCDEKSWDTECSPCCQQKMKECLENCPADDQKACSNDCSFQQTMCAGLCKEQIRFEKDIADNVTGIELQCTKVK